MSWLERLFERCFKVYLTLSLILFVILILLTNLPRLLAAEPTLPALVAAERTAALESAAFPEMKNPLTVKVSAAKLGDMTGEGRFVEYRGNKLSFVIRF